MAARKCYVAMLEMDDHLQALNVEEKRIAVEPIEDLEEVSLDGSVPRQTTYFGTQADPSVHRKLVLLLKSNWEVFAWRHKDMSGIIPIPWSTSLMCAHPSPQFDRRKGSLLKKRIKP